jgi:hypothetical protein
MGDGVRDGHEPVVAEGVGRDGGLLVHVGVPRAVIASADPGQAEIVALIAYHGLPNGQLRDLQLVDVQRGKLTLGERVIPLAPAGRDRIGTYLDERERS